VLASNSKKTSATPSVDSLSEARLFENIFGKVFFSSDA
jgi:hypothetical protein